MDAQNATNKNSFVQNAKLLSKMEMYTHTALTLIMSKNKHVRSSGVLRQMNKMKINASDVKLDPTKNSSTSLDSKDFVFQAAIRFLETFMLHFLIKIFANANLDFLQKMISNALDVLSLTVNNVITINVSNVRIQK